MMSRSIIEEKRKKKKKRVVYVHKIEYSPAMNQNHPAMITVIPLWGGVNGWVGWWGGGLDFASLGYSLFAYRKTASNNWPVVISDRYTTAATWPKKEKNPKNFDGSRWMAGCVMGRRPSGPKQQTDGHIARRKSYHIRQSVDADTLDMPAWSSPGRDVTVRMKSSLREANQIKQNSPSCFV